MAEITVPWYRYPVDYSLDPGTPGQILPKIPMTAPMAAYATDYGH